MEGATFNLLILKLGCKPYREVNPVITNPRNLRKMHKWPTCVIQRGGLRARGSEKRLLGKAQPKKRRGKRGRRKRRRSLMRGSQPCSQPAVTLSTPELVRNPDGSRKRRTLVRQYKRIDRVFAIEDRIYARILQLERRLKTSRKLNPGIKALVRRLREQGEILREIHTYQTKVLGSTPITDHIQPDGNVVKFKKAGRDEGRFEESQRKEGEGHCPICSYLTLEIEKHLRKKHAAKGRAMADAMFGAVGTSVLAAQPSPVGGQRRSTGIGSSNLGGPIQRQGAVKGRRR